MKQCIAIGSTSHGKWSYRTAVVYTAGVTKAGEPVWIKDSIVAEATTDAKILRLASAAAERLGVPLMPAVRHYSPRRVA